MIRSTHDGSVTLKQGAKFFEQLKYPGWTFETLRKTRPVAFLSGPTFVA